jgi:hypothetical protein
LFCLQQQQQQQQQDKAAGAVGCASYGWVDDGHVCT